MKRAPLRLLRAGRVPYLEALRWQQKLEEQRLSKEIPDTVIALEHPPVVTLGHRADQDNVVASDSHMEKIGIEVHRTSRGGDVTYHGPGQIVVYPIVQLGARHLTVAEFVGKLEETMIRTAGCYDVKAQRLERRPGVFVGNDKIGAVGIHVSRGVTTHGLAFNVAPDLSHYELIVPCGLRKNGVTSLARATGQAPRLSDVEDQLLRYLADVLRSEMVEISPEDAGLL